MTNLSPSLEAYLETIFRLEEEYRVARVKDIAKSLGVQMSSVSGALKNLRDRGFVNYEKNSFIFLTDLGIKSAKEIVLKHYILEDFLKRILSVDPVVASKEACGMKHVISTDTAIRIKNLFE